MEQDELCTIYDEQDRKIMKLAGSACLPGKNRVEEIRSYALQAGIKRIGIAHCAVVYKEAEMLKNKLSTEFEVFAISCKSGKIPNSEFLGEDAKGISCNPAGQATYLENNKTELNIKMGLCMGHDLIFTAKSKCPVTTLIVKDRAFKHNPIKAFEKEKEMKCE